MKSYKKIVLSFLCCLSLIISGCSSWLDYTPKDKQTADQQFSTREGFYNAVNGIYNLLSSSSLYGYNLSYGSIDIMGQCYKISSSSTSNYAFQQYTWSNTTVSSTFSNIWSSAYSAILNINVVLSQIDKQKAELTDVDYKLIKGEMLAVRAFLHFDLLRLFGPIYSKNPTGASVPFNDGIEAARRDRLPAETMINDKLLPDITTAQTLLKDVDPVITEGPLNSDGGDKGNLLRYRQLRMNYYAVCLLKARIYLWQGDYDNAILEAQKITDDANVAKWFPFVVPSKLLANNTNPDRIFSTECLFGCYKKGMSDIFQDNFSGTLDPTVVLQPRKGYIDIMFPVSGDYRRQSQWTASSSSSGGDYDFIKYKSFTANSSNPEFWATFFGLMRISEAYYIAAESFLQKKDLDKACYYLSIIQKARGLSEIKASDTDSDNLLKEIKLEYLRELRGEGQIYFMFKRFVQDFATTGSWWKPDPGNSIFNAAESPSSDYDYSDSRYIISIPESEIN